jgi:hypothetical protein
MQTKEKLSFTRHGTLEGSLPRQTWSIWTLVHVKVALEDPLLESIWLGALGLGLGGGGLDGRLGHVGDRLGPIVLDTSSWGRSGGEREGGSRARDGALGSRPQLLGPIETLLVCAGVGRVRRGSWKLLVACLYEGRGRRREQDTAGPARGGRRGRSGGGNSLGAGTSGLVGWGDAITVSWAAVGTVVPHGRASEAHATDKGSVGVGLGVSLGGVVVINGALVDGVGVGGHAAASHAVRDGGGGRCAGQAQGGNGEATAVAGGGVDGLGGSEGRATGEGVATLEEVGEGRLGDGAATRATAGLAVGSVVRGHFMVCCVGE